MNFESFEKSDRPIISTCPGFISTIDKLETLFLPPDSDIHGNATAHKSSLAP